MGWPKPEYDKSDVKKAGSILRNEKRSEKEISGAIEILNNWRAIHSYPLHVFQVTLNRVSKKRDKKNSLVAQRLKRESSIVRKLKRRYDNKKPTMELTQMQDIAGCRTIVKNVKIAREIYEQDYLKGNLKHKIVGKKDYVKHPKSDGYRSLHVMYEYKSDKNKTEYNGLRVEVQIRTKLQHIWATTVETVDFITGKTGKPIKFNENRSEWIDFFKLVSSAFAIKENCPTIEPVDNIQSLYAEIKKKEARLKVMDRLDFWRATSKFFNEETKGIENKAKFFLLELDIKGKRLMMQSFTKKSEERAIKEYSELEKRHRGKSDYDVVLIGAETIKDLKKAYPNYFADTEDFISELKEITNKVK